MSKNTEVLKKIEMYQNIQQSEAKNHWTRNSCFLVVESFLILALSQFSSSSYQSLIGFFGIILSASWLLIQDRSSRYIKYWKNEVQELQETADIPTIYPRDLGGIEMRKVAYILPILFLGFWLVVILINYGFIIGPEMSQNMTQNI